MWRSFRFTRVRKVSTGWLYVRLSKDLEGFQLEKSPCIDFLFALLGLLASVKEEIWFYQGSSLVDTHKGITASFVPSCWPSRSHLREADADRLLRIRKARQGSLLIVAFGVFCLRRFEIPRSL